MAETLKGKITKRLVEAAVPPPAGEIRIWDTELRGFMVRVTAGGRRSYAVKYRFNGQQRWLKIGDHGFPWTPDMARTRAIEIIGSARMGRDPSAKGPSAPNRARATDWSDEVEDDAPIAAGLGGDSPVKAGKMRDATVSELYELYLREGPKDKPLKRESSWQVDRTSYLSHVKPLIGSAKARALRPTDLAAFQAAVAEGKSARDRRTGRHGRSMVRGGRGAAVRAMRTLSAMFSWAVWREFMDSNPATKVQKLRETPRDRPITTEEARRLWRVLDEAQAAWVIAPTYADMIRLIMLTGARRNEIAELSWSEVDLANARLLLPPVRTKMGVLNKARTIVLSEPAREILERQPRQSVHVFPSRIDGKAAVGINKAWLKARALAGLDDVRLHDLRHSFATFAVEDGASLFLVGRALGHKSAVSTERYAHPRDAAAHEIAAKIAARILQTNPVDATPSPSATPAFAAVSAPPEAANDDFETAVRDHAPWLA
jgi:integrase